MTAHNPIPDAVPEAVLTDDQRHACDWLVSLARVRADTTEEGLPTHVLNRWVIPLLVGSAGSGKNYVCEEVARRLGGLPCRRWDVRPWVTTANRDSDTTLEQLVAYIEANPGGCVVYLAGVDALMSESDNSYLRSVISEVTQFLDQASTRPVRFQKRNGSLIQAKALVIVGGCFAELWGDADVGSPHGADAWQLADREPPSVATAAKWLLECSQLPSSVLQRLSPEPMILRRIDGAQIEKIALRLRDNLPRSLDGLGTAELCAALQSPYGWRAVAALIERAWVEGHEPLPTLEVGAETPAPVPQIICIELPEFDHSDPNRLPPRLGERLGIPSNRSRLIAKARRLGLCTAADLNQLAAVRGYRLPGEDEAETAAAELISRTDFSDIELMAALLSPCIEWHVQAICRGVWMLATFMDGRDPAYLYHEINRARGHLIVRHVARIGRKIYPDALSWRSLLNDYSWMPDPSFQPGMMPDELIRRILATFASRRSEKSSAAE